MTGKMFSLYLAAVSASAFSDGSADAVAETTAALRRYRLAVAEQRRAKERWREARVSGHTAAPWLTPPI